MQLNEGIEKLKDLFLFRESEMEDEDGGSQPVITTGSVVWGIILRFALILVIGFIMVGFFEIRHYWWIILFFLWFGAVYPGWRQFQIFQKRIKQVEDSTLCGSCIHFESSGQLCKIFDEHITNDFIPCEGQNWEPRHIDSEI